MDRKLTKKEYIILASMMFGLFFGAGNLIFPIHMGELAGRNFLPAVIGFCITGVGLPLLGITAIGITKSNGLFDLSHLVSKKFAYFFTCALYLTIGPLFAIPRTATVSFQVGVASFIPKSNQSLALFIFSLLFFAFVLYFSLKPSGIMTWVGIILNPAFLIFLGILIAAAVFNPMGNISQVAPQGQYATKSLMTGVLDGYNTMDALAALAFGIILVNSIKKLGVEQPEKISAITVKSGLLTVAAMAGIYALLTYAGAQVATAYPTAPDGGITFYTMARHYFGLAGAVILGITITLACLKTSIGLVTSCAETFQNIFPTKFGYKGYAIVFSIFSFAIANIGLSQIISISIPVLMFLYPLTIVLIILALCGRYFNYNKNIFVWCMRITLLASVCEFLIALPKSFFTSFSLVKSLPHLYTSLPLASYGMAWVIPSLIGVVIGIIFMILENH